MKKLLIIVIFAFLVLNVTKVNAANSNLKYFGYYNIDGYTDNTTNRVLEIAGLQNSNVSFVNDTFLNPTISTSILQNIQSSKMLALINPQWIFFDGASTSGICNAQGATIRANWQTIWSNYKNNIYNKFKDNILGFYFDEPSCQGISREMFKSFSSQIKADFPDKKILVIESYYAVDNNIVDSDFYSNITDFGVDYYYTSTVFGVQGKTTWQDFLNYFNKAKQIVPNKNYWIVPDGFLKNNELADKSKIFAAYQNYLNLAQNDSSIIGILNFVYPTIFSDSYSLKDFFTQGSPAYYPDLLNTQKSSGSLIISSLNCTNIQYSDWSSCNNSTQSRTITNSYPLNCNTSSAQLTQSCTNPDPLACTSLNQCSGTKPTYCNSQGRLENNCNLCGCPDGLTCSSSNNECITKTPDPTPLKCSDGTQLNSCSNSKPFYCNDSGNLINNCNQCGCGANEICENNSCKKIEQQIVTDTACTKVTFSKWSQCVNGVQKRTILGTEPSNCTLSFKPLLSRSCLVSYPVVDDQNESEVVFITPSQSSNSLTSQEAILVGVIIGGAFLLICGNALLIARAIRKNRNRLNFSSSLNVKV